MMKLLDTTYQLFVPAKAEEVAASLAAGDLDGWTYVVRHDPKGTGYSFIEGYDEAGKYVERI